MGPSTSSASITKAWPTRAACSACNRTSSSPPAYSNRSLMSTLEKLRKSFSYAAKGIMVVARVEQNFRVQLLVAAAVVVLMFALGLRTSEKALLTLAIVLVLVLELVNSIFERLVDMMKPRLHHYAEDIKDI